MRIFLAILAVAMFSFFGCASRQSTVQQPDNGISSNVEVTNEDGVTRVVVSYYWFEKILLNYAVDYSEGRRTEVKAILFGHIDYDFYFDDEGTLGMSISTRSNYSRTFVCSEEFACPNWGEEEVQNRLIADRNECSRQRLFWERISSSLNLNSRVEEALQAEMEER